MGKGRSSVVVAFACIALMAGWTSVAHAQSGGTDVPGSTTTTPAPAPTATTAGSWTVYKSATWYGPGLWGEETACGMVLAATTVGVAHRKLPCGTQVTFSYNGRTTSATVIDRGPFRKGYAWDLTKKTAKQLGFLEVGEGPVAATVTPVYY
jgi:rare lipoprotein A (peptidoglycan hydrolase)